MDADSLFLRGKEAADRGNYDYAIAIFLDVLRATPTHRNSRIALRGCEMEKFRECGGGLKARLLAFFKGIAPLIMMHLVRGKPEKVMGYCERYLVNDPVNIHVLTRLASACARLGYLDAAADTLEFARQRKPRRIGILRRLGEAHFQQGQYDKAVRCFQEIRNIRPNDREASGRVREISAVSHLKRSHLGEAQSYRETLRDEDKARTLERETRITRSAEEMQTEIVKQKQAVEADPNDAEAHLRLGDAYYRFERYAEAEGAYRKAFEIGKRYIAREKLGNARIHQLDKLEHRAQEEAEESGQDPKRVAAAREARRRRLEFCVKEFEFRRKQHPTDMKLTWTLGQYYFQLGGEENIQRAIPQFQQAMSSTGLKIRAQYMLGRCFAMNPKTLDMAKEQFLKALEGVEDPISDTSKMLTYELAAVAEKLGDASEALDWYKKIFAVDAGYRDVAKKIQELG